MTNKKPLIIGVAGGSGSGKTTIVSEIIKEIGHIGVVVIPHDAYYKSNSHLVVEERAKLNYDHPDALETDLLVEHLKELIDGNEIEMPVYDYTIHSRKPMGVIIRPAPVIIVDGILIFTEKALRDLMDVKIFVDTDSDIRFIRRLQRDMTERNRSKESIIHQYLETVKPMHIAFVEPSQRYADIIIPRGHHTVSTGVVVQMIRQAITDQGSNGNIK